MALKEATRVVQQKDSTLALKGDVERWCCKVMIIVSPSSGVCASEEPTRS